MRRPLAFLLLGYLASQALVYGASWIDGKPSPFNIFNLIASPSTPASEV